ncbi:hypothetical protein [Burkholderia ambifaria]|uniref:hypothetical protein n=1 Tax=Burkholderia ambifaria TaxID=152480 RepID=UPI000F8023E4|nr:hypothetical protein [Burkholderia ambifaria]
MADLTQKPDTMFDRPWEDTLIIALRDLQWKKAIARTTLRENLPDGTLLKLDGNAESAVGDVITAVQGRYFVLELKADAGTMGAETEKTLPALVDRLANSATQAAQAFVKLSKMAHHLAFSEETDGTRTSAAGILERPFRVSTATYLTVAAGVVDSKDYRPAFERDVVALMYDKHEWPGESDKVRLGLPAAAMAAYLKFLVEAHRREGGRLEHPLKAIVLSDQGFMWPCVNMASLSGLVAYLDTSLDNAPTLQTQAEKWFALLAPALPAPTAKPSTPATSKPI